MKRRESLREGERKSEEKNESAGVVVVEKTNILSLTIHFLYPPYPIALPSSPLPANDAVQDHDDAHALRRRRAQGE
jgi:hypothetical protein